MKHHSIFCSSGKLDLGKHMISEEHLPVYMAGAIEEEGVDLTEDVFIMMVGKELTGETKTLLFFINGTVKKTPVSPCLLHKSFGLKKGVQNQGNLRQALNYYLKKRPQYPAFVTPTTTFSRAKQAVWISLNLAIKYRRSPNKKDKMKRSLIDFSFGATLELHVGIQSVRHTFFVDVIEAWTIQLNHLLGAQPLTHIAGVTNPENHYMVQKIANKNTMIEKQNEQTALNRIKKQSIDIMVICPEEFIDTLHIISKFIPLNKHGYFEEADIDDFPRNQRQLVKKILRWKEGK
ncbi:hypothetical protein [uncultured Vagococcus sp.]|uniref:hypothetical protein n=1 Tax=uncultured Vagococcus sp. TaxID=189676 RepID=UPI0028D2349B|nr:hypothetical protein [uncultured Vagococcus sp.]